MKKLVLALSLIVVSVSAMAQRPTESPLFKSFRLGLTAHPTFGWVSPNEGKSNGLRLGFSYGMVADFNFAENYSLNTGVTITTMNGKTTEVGVKGYDNVLATDALDLTYKLQYIEIPLVIKLKSDKIGDIRWFGQFGLSNGFNIGAKQDAYKNNEMIGKDRSIGSQISFYRAGLVIGGGAEFELDKKTSISTGLTLNNGFTNIISDGSRKARNSFVDLQIAIYF